MARRRDLLEKLATDFASKYGVKCLVIAADLSISQDIEKVIEETKNLDVGLLINAAGFGTSGKFVDISVAEEISMLDVNCRAVLLLTHYFANVFRSKKRGGIILFSSIVAFQGVPLSANYAATKAYIQTFAEGLRVEMSKFGVDVLSVAPGPVNTGFAKRAKINLGSGADKPEVIAKGALQALGKKSTVRPGFIAKFLGYSLIMAPRFIRVIIMTAIMRGMTKS